MYKLKAVLLVPWIQVSHYMHHWCCIHVHAACLRCVILAALHRGRWSQWITWLQNGSCWFAYFILPLLFLYTDRAWSFLESLLPYFRQHHLWALLLLWMLREVLNWYYGNELQLVEQSNHTSGYCCISVAVSPARYSRSSAVNISNWSSATKLKCWSRRMEVLSEYEVYV